MIKKFIDAISQKKLKLFVIGDVAIDEYYQVHVSRISPEAPIQVLSSQSFAPISVPGCAGNTAEQFKYWNVDCHLFGLFDNTSKEIYDKFSFHTHSADLVNGFIPVKRRLHEGTFPLTRWDIEKPNYGSLHIEQARQNLMLEFEAMVREQKPDVVVVSDYCKGLFDYHTASQVIQICNINNVFSIVDPKEDMGKWMGCSLFKPNYKEASIMTGVQNIHQQLVMIKRQLRCKHVVITNSSDGAYVLSDTVAHVKIKSKLDVKNTVGAGDAFSTFLAMAVPFFSVVDSVKIAVDAASVYVQKQHNHPVSPMDLSKFSNSLHAKILSEPIELPGKVIFTNGCFDFGLTRAHVEYLNEAKKLGDLLVVGINSDASVQRLKGENRPVMPLLDRMTVVAGLESVDYVIPFEEDTPLELIKSLLPHTIVKGGYKAEDVVGREYAQVVVFDKIECSSTTDKITRCRVSEK